jgi:hypothetical protein
MKSTLEGEPMDQLAIPTTLEEMLAILGALSLADIARVREAFSDVDPVTNRPRTGEFFDSDAALAGVLDVRRDQELRTAHQTVRAAMEARAWLETPPGYGAWSHLADLGAATLAVRRLGAGAPPRLVERVAAAWAAARPSGAATP